MMIELLPRHLEELVISSYKSGYSSRAVGSSSRSAAQPLAVTDPVASVVAAVASVACLAPSSTVEVALVGLSS